MSDDYLWDKSGAPDPDVARLEEILAPLRSDPPAYRPVSSSPRRFARLAWAPALAAAAGLVLAVAFWWRPARPPAPQTGPVASDWTITSVAGAPIVGRAAVTNARPLKIGDTVATDGQSSARISSSDVGEVVIDPGSLVRLVRSGRGDHRLALVHGALQAFIVAPPGRFVVETRSATAVDLGCVYTLRAGESGDGVLSVQVGWVGFEFGGRESFVPAGASCRTSARGPGLPRFDDADRRFVEAVDELEEDSPAARADSLHAALDHARPRDAVTLWHLLSRVTDAERPLVVAALRARVPLPEGVAEEAVLRLDRQALDRWWNALGLGDIDVWRAWERPLASSR